MDDSVPPARRGLAIYLVAVVILSTPLQIGIIATDALAETSSSIARVLPPLRHALRDSPAFDGE
jgi:hypothetical protein